MNNRTNIRHPRGFKEALIFDEKALRRGVRVLITADTLAEEPVTGAVVSVEAEYLVVQPMEGSSKKGNQITYFLPGFLQAGYSIDSIEEPFVTVNDVTITQSDINTIVSSLEYTCGMLEKEGRYDEMDKYGTLIDKVEDLLGGIY